MITSSKCPDSVQKPDCLPDHGSSRRIPLAAWMVTAVFILSNSATPLYVRWQQVMSFSSGTLTVIFAAYIAGLLGTLLVAGQLSDRWGRKPLLLPGFASAMAACLLFATATSVGMLILARSLTGIAVGIIVSAGMAAVVDVGGAHSKKQASLVASVAMVLGAGLGPMLSGLFAQFSGNPVPIVFGLEFVLLLSALVVSVSLPLPSLRYRKSELESTRLRLPSVSKEHRRDLFLGIAVFGPGITATSFVLSLGPSLLSQILHVKSPLVAGGTACLMFMAATGVQFIVRQLPVRTIFLSGAAATAIAMMAMAGAVHTSVAYLLVIAAIMAGAGQGLGQLGGLTLIATRVADKRRAEANALLNIGGYIPAGLLPVATGYLIDAVGLVNGATAFTVLLLIVAMASATCVGVVMRKRA